MPAGWKRSRGLIVFCPALDRLEVRVYRPGRPGEAFFGRDGVAWTLLGPAKQAIGNRPGTPDRPRATGRAATFHRHACDGMILTSPWSMGA